MTPAAKPSIPSSIRWLNFFVAKTTLAPSAVTNQVKQVAKKACSKGGSPARKFIIFLIPHQFGQL
jgi:hypothetical protein